jgi:hypothetical protein
MLRWSIALICLGLLIPAGAENPAPKLRNVCRNGGFEEVKPFRGQDHPTAWFVDGPVENRPDPLSPVAHSGKRSGRLVSKDGAEAGMNLDLPGVTNGTLKFWYQAVKSAPGGNLVVWLIPMREANGMMPAQEIDLMGNGSGRVGYLVPTEHAGDGKWHQAEVEFDFRAAGAGHIVLAPRINQFTPGSGPGELLLDDVEVLVKP